MYKIKNNYIILYNNYHINQIYILLEYFLISVLSKYYQNKSFSFIV